jgi:hypothetical protein
MQKETAAPVAWYREPYVWMLIAIPATAVVMGAIILRFAIISYDGLVADDYYKRGKEINRVLERDQVAQRLGLAADVAIEPDGDRLFLKLSAQKGFTYPPRISLRFLHATRAGLDQELMVERLPDGRYFALLKRLVPGRWYVQLETPAWRVSGAVKLPEQHTTSLKPSL